MQWIANHITLALLLFSGCGSGDIASGPVMDERTPVPQEAVERIFPAGEMTVIDTLRVDDPTFWPVKLVVLDSGELLVADRGSFQVVRLTADGEILVRYGAGTGEGPGEHQGIDKVGQLADGTVWTWDILNRRINLFEAAGSFIASESPQTHIQVATALTSEDFVGVSPLNPDPFVAFDRNGRITGRWGRFVDEPGPQAMPYIGKPQRLEDGAGFVYVPQFAGRLYAYDIDGGLLWHRSVIDRIDIPTVSGGEMDFGEDGLQLQQFRMNVFDDDIHIRVIVGNYENFYLDTYDAASGDYRHSLQYRLKAGCAPLFVARDVLYMQCESNIVRFRIPER